MIWSGAEPEVVQAHSLILMDSSSILHRAATVSVTTASPPNRTSEKSRRYRWNTFFSFLPPLTPSTGKPRHCSNACCKTL